MLSSGVARSLLHNGMLIFKNAQKHFELNRFVRFGRKVKISVRFGRKVKIGDRSGTRVKTGGRLGGRVKIGGRFRTKLNITLF